MAQKKLIDIDLLALYDGLIKQKIEDERDAAETYAYELVQTSTEDALYVSKRGEAVYNDKDIVSIINI